MKRSKFSLLLGRFSLVGKVQTFRLRFHLTSKCQVRRLTGGITNVLYRVTSEVDNEHLRPSKRSGLVRGNVAPLTAQSMVPTLKRSSTGPTRTKWSNGYNEIVSHEKLAEHDLCAPLYGLFANGCCYGFVPGEPETVETMQQRTSA